MADSPINWRNRIVGYGTKPADQFLANPDNWRKHPKRQREAVATSLRALGWIDVAIENIHSGHLIDGHERVWQGLANDNADVPYIQVDLDDDEERMALAVIDPLASMAETDAELLGAILDDLRTSAIAVDDEQVRALLNAVAGDAGIPFETPVNAPEPQLDRAEALRDLWQTERGQVWGIPSATVEGRVHRVMCGDSTSAEDVARLMGDERAQVVVTSPPYNQNIETFKPSGMQKESTAFVDRMASSYADSLPEDDYQRGQITLLEMLPQFMMGNGSIFYNHKIRYRNKAIISPLEWLTKLSYPIRQEIIWDRGSSITLNARMFIPADERVYWLRVGDDFVFNDTLEIKSYSTVWQIGAHNDISISAAFATEIPKRCINASTSPGDIAFDPFLGSGTTACAAEQTGRICCGMELEPKYVAVTLQRLADMGLMPQLCETIQDT